MNRGGLSFVVEKLRGSLKVDRGSARSGFVAVAISLQLFQQTAPGVFTIVQPFSQAVSITTQPSTAPEYQELIERRTQHSKTYVKETPTGPKYKLYTTTAPLHYQAADGTWQDISLDFTALPNGEYTNTSNSFESVFAAHSGQPTLATVSRESFRMRISAPVEHTVSARLNESSDGQRLEYPDTLTGATVAFRMEPDRLVKEFILTDQAAVQDEYSFILSFDPGGSAVAVDGEVLLKQDDMVVARLPRPLLYELHNRSRGWQSTEGVIFRVDQLSPTTYRVSKVLTEEGKAWISAVERQFPIALDATINAQTGASTDDATMGSITTDSGRAVASSALMDLTNIKLEPGDHGTNNEHSVGIRFTNITIPNAEPITSATLSLTPYATYSASPNVVKFHVSAEDVDDATTFSSSDGDLLASVRPRTTADAGPWTQTSIVGDVEESVAVTSVVQEVIDRAGWASGNDLNILIDTHADTTLNEWQDYYSYNGSTSKAPKLVIEYGGGTPTYEQEGYRWRDDNGSETTASWLDSQDTNITRATGTNTRLRMLINTTGDAPSNQYRLEYKKSTDSGYQKVGPAPSTATPVVEARSTGATTTTNTTSHAITMPTGITAGELLLIVFSSDGQPDVQINTGGWRRLDQARNSTIVTGAVFYKFAEGSDTATVTTSATEQSSHVVLRISGAGIPYAANANGSSTNSNPPSLDMGTSRNHLWVATRSSDSTVVATAAPSSYSNLQTQAAAGTGGASTNTAEYSTTAATEDPGTFTSNTEQWVSFTIGIPPADTVGGVRYVANQSNGTTSLSLAYPPNIQAGDLLIMAIANKHTPNGPSTPSGWTAPSNNQNSGSAGSDGLDTGSVYATVFTKIADGTESGNQSVTITSGNSATGEIIQLRAASGKVWSTALASGNDTTVDTSWSVTAGSDPGITAGDVVLTVSAMNTDAYAWSAQSLSATSVTFVSNQEISEAGTTNGNDLEMTVAAHLAGSGTSSAAPVFTMTSSGVATSAPVGATIFVRARQVDAPIILSASSNITASGENTTALLSAPSGKTTSDFDAGRMQDDENPADAVDITSDDYTELEWSLQATSTAASSEVYQFRITLGGTALDTYSVTPQWTIGSGNSTFTLSSYRWYVDSDNENVTDPWGNPNLAEDTALALLPATNAAPASGDELRLRVAITIGTSDLSATSQQFKLQYKAGTDETCTTGSWTDVGAGGGGEIWRFATSSVTDGTTLTALKLTVADVLGVYAKSSPTTSNPNAATIGQDIEYDFHIQQNGAGNASIYSFRVVESDGTEFATYTECPTLSTRQTVDQELRHGDVFGNEIERGFVRVD